MLVLRRLHRGHKERPERWLWIMRPLQQSTVFLGSLTVPVRLQRERDRVTCFYDDRLSNPRLLFKGGKKENFRNIWQFGTQSAFKHGAKFEREKNTDSSFWQKHACFHCLLIYSRQCLWWRILWWRVFWEPLRWPALCNMDMAGTSFQNKSLFYRPLQLEDIQEVFCLTSVLWPSPRGCSQAHGDMFNSLVDLFG